MTSKEYMINGKEAQIIADTSKVRVKQPVYASSFHLSKEERKKRAAGILNK